MGFGSRGAEMAYAAKIISMHRAGKWVSDADYEKYVAPTKKAYTPYVLYNYGRTYTSAYR